MDKDPPRAGSREEETTAPAGDASRPAPTRLATGSQTLPTPPGRAPTTPASTVEEDGVDRGEPGSSNGAEPPEQAVRLTMPRTLTPLPTATTRFMLALSAGSPVGEYLIQDQIGEGAMGTVYTAVQPLIGKTVAIKVLKPELCTNQASIDRFVQEAQAVNRIGHPNIVDVFSLGELFDGRAYMVMEWLRGEDLKARLARGPIAVADACDILDGIARALDAAHAKDIVHRDLKPDNVFLHRIGDGPVMVKLLDFGIAKLMRAQTMEKTATGNMLGTPRYISPEQARGIDVTHRSDIYSLGVMAYEMLAGRPPFQGETAMDLVVKHLSEPPPPLSQFTRVPRSLEQCVMRMIAKDPAQRPSLAEVRQILVDPSRRLARPSLLRRAPVIAAGVTLAAAAALIAWKVTSNRGERTDHSEPAPVAAVVASVPAPVAPKKEPIDGEGALAARTVKGVGTVVVQLDKPDAPVKYFIDGVEWNGKDRVEEGEHEVEVRANGKATKRRVVVTPGETQSVWVDVPVAAAKPPPVVVRRPPATAKPPPAVKKPPPPSTKLDDNTLMGPSKSK